MKIKYHQTEEFKKDLKRLSKRFRTIVADLEVAKQYSIEIYHLGLSNISYIKKITTKVFNDKEVSIYKLRRFACKSVGHATDKIRLIYAYSDYLVTLLEIYFKGDADNEDQGRIDQFLKSL